MEGRNLVVFKGNVDGITVILDEKAEFDQVLAHFKQKLNESKAFFKGSKIGIRFKGRLLEQQEQDALINLLRHQEIIDISFVHKFENETKITHSEDDEMMWIKNELNSLNASLTYFHYGIVRSGMEIDYPGNVIIFGDVNPGGSIKASASVIVFGMIKGKVHAGLDSRFKHPFIIGMGMAPIQLGIRNVIAPCPEQKKVVLDTLQVAYLVNEKIFIDVLDSKSVNSMLSISEH